MHKNPDRDPAGRRASQQAAGPPATTTVSCVFFCRSKQDVFFLRESADVATLRIPHICWSLASCQLMTASLEAERDFQSSSTWGSGPCGGISPRVCFRLLFFGEIQVTVLLKRWINNFCPSHCARLKTSVLSCTNQPPFKLFNVHLWLTCLFKVMVGECGLGPRRPSAECWDQSHVSHQTAGIVEAEGVSLHGECLSRPLGAVMFSTSPPLLLHRTAHFSFLPCSSSATVAEVSGLNPCARVCAPAASAGAQKRVSFSSGVPSLIKSCWRSVSQVRPSTPTFDLCTTPLLYRRADGSVRDWTWWDLLRWIWHMDGMSSWCPGLSAVLKFWGFRSAVVYSTGNRVGKNLHCASRPKWWKWCFSFFVSWFEVMSCLLSFLDSKRWRLTSTKGSTRGFSFYFQKVTFRFLKRNSLWTDQKEDSFMYLFKRLFAKSTLGLDSPVKGSTNGFHVSSPSRGQRTLTA